MRPHTRRGALGVLVCATALAGGCSAVLGIHDLAPPADGGAPSEAGADHAATDAATDAAGNADAGEGSGPADASSEADVAQTQCTPVTVVQPPMHGGAACMTDASAGTCYPHDQSTWTPYWAPPVGPKAGACTSQQIQDFYLDCLSSGTVGGCNAWIAANASCHDCLFTGVGSTAFGAIIGGQLTQYLNVGGCIAALEPCNAACGMAFNAFFQCELESCDSYCSPNQSAGLACENQSGACSACEGFIAAAECSKELTGPMHPAYGPCLQNVNGAYAAAYTGVAQALCGM